VLKFAFWSLLGLNLVFFAYSQGMLGTVSGSEHEPARARNQLAIDRIRIVSAGEAQGALEASKAEAAKAEAPREASAAPAPVREAAPAQELPKAPVVACTEVGSFGSGEARRFETRLARLDLGERLSRRTVQEQEVSSYLVYIPPQGSKEAAERKAGELRNLGVTDFLIMPTDGPYKWALSLGVFKSEQSAQALQASLNKQGVHTARVAPRGPLATRYVYQFRGIDAATRKRIEGYAEKFEGAEVKSCS
jgi:hypothetical protein